MSNSSITRQPTCIKTLPMDYYIQIELTAHIFPIKFRIEVCSLLFSGECFPLFFYLPHLSLQKLPHSFPSSTRLCGFESPFVVRPRILTNGYPSPRPH
jgi:hypothetical protein